MACGAGWISKEQIERAAKALREFEADLVMGKYTIVRNNRGELKVTNWNQSNAAKAGWCDGCALREIQQKGSWIAKQKLAQYGITSKPFTTIGHSHNH